MNLLPNSRDLIRLTSWQHSGFHRCFSIQSNTNRFFSSSVPFPPSSSSSKAISTFGSSFFFSSSTREFASRGSFLQSSPSSLLCRPCFYRSISSSFPSSLSPSLSSFSSPSLFPSSPSSAPSTSSSSSSSSSTSASPSSSPVADTVILSLAEKDTTGVSLRQMFQLGYKPSPTTLLSSAQFLHREIPIRLAKRIRDLQDLPFGLSQSVEVRTIAERFKESLSDTLQLPYPTNQQQELLFAYTMRQILIRHQHVIINMQYGASDSFLSLISRVHRQHFLLQEFLDRFNIARIGMRMLLSQHVALHSPRDEYVGVIHGKCNPASVVADAIEDAQTVILQKYGCCPPVQVTDKANLTFRYVPGHIRYMVFELLKNSMRATVEFEKSKANPEETSTSGSGINSGSSSSNHSSYSSLDFPPIQIVIVDGEHDVIIKVSDRGGGIKRSDMPKLFTYTFTTAKPTPQEIESQQKLYQQRQSAPTPPSRPPSPLTLADLKLDSDWLFGDQSVMNAGAMFGNAFGLPLSRLYARYFGGDLQIFSLHGHGTDAYLYLNKLGNTQEVMLD